MTTRHAQPHTTGSCAPIVRPEPPVGGRPLTPVERQALALSATGYRTTDLCAELGLRRLSHLWNSIAAKLGADGHQGPRRQAGFVFRARIHGLLDLPDPADPGDLPPDVLALVRALALGKTLKQHAIDLQKTVWDVEATARQARQCLDGALTQPHLVHRALPRLLTLVRTPGEDPGPGRGPGPGPGAGPGMGLGAAAAPTARHLSTELPADGNAVFLSRIWMDTCVTVLGWHGPTPTAIEAISSLMDHAVRHTPPTRMPAPQPRIRITAAVTETGQLILHVSNHNPTLPDLTATTPSEKNRGLHRTTHHGITLTWHQHHPGTTIHATLTPTPTNP